MLYTPSNTKQETSKKGTPYWKCEVIDTNGQHYPNVTSFSAVIDGKQVDGFLERNDYKGTEGYILKLQESVRTGGKTAQMEKVMDKKAGQIAESQDRKEIGIARSGSITNATHLVVALITSGIIPSSASESAVQDAVVRYAKWYRAMYNHDDFTAKELEHVSMPPF